jgi:hypothetical protein
MRTSQEVIGSLRQGWGGAHIPSHSGSSSSSNHPVLLLLQLQAQQSLQHHALLCACQTPPNPQHKSSLKICTCLQSLTQVQQQCLSHLQRTTLSVL